MNDKRDDGHTTGRSSHRRSLNSETSSFVSRQADDAKATSDARRIYVLRFTDDDWYTPTARLPVAGCHARQFVVAVVRASSVGWRNEWMHRLWIGHFVSLRNCIGLR